MKTILLSLLYAFCFFSGHASSDDEEKIIYTAKYKSSYSGVPITLKKELVQLSNTRFLIRSRAKSLVGSIGEDSFFIVSGSQVLPILYEYRVKALGKKSTRNIRFDWSENLAHFTRSDKPSRNKSYEIDRGTLDRSLYLLKLQQQLASDDYPLEFHYARAGGIKHRAFEMNVDASSDQVHTVDGIDYKVTTFDQINNKGDKHLSVSVIPELHNQIAEIVRSEANGKRHRVRLVSFSADSAALDSLYKRLSRNTAL